MPDDNGAPPKSNNPPEFGAAQSRDYTAYQEFIRCSYVNIYGKVTDQAYAEYYAERDANHAGEPETRESATRIMDKLPGYQLKAWGIRNLRRLKYSQPQVGIDCMVQDQAGTLEPELNDLIADAGERLRLNPDLEMPDYFTMVDFHQQPGGVWRDDVDGLIYDYGRRTTNPNETDANRVYQLLWDRLPRDREYKTVLDWGTGHGGGLVHWLQNNPDSTGYGVDVAAPCVKLAYVRAKEGGVADRATFLQEDIGHMSLDDESVDLVFHMFMLHELPQSVTPALFREVHRVLKPGGIFIGGEVALQPDQPAQHVMQFTDAFLNNEPYMGDCVLADYPAMARDAGFSNAESIRFDLSGDGSRPRTENAPPIPMWNHHVFEK